MREEENGRGEKDRKSVPPETEKGTGAEGKGRIPGWNTRHGTPEALPHEAAGKAVAPITETALRPDTKNPAPDKGGINPQIRGVRRFRIRNGVPCRKQPQDTGRAWRTLRMAGEGCQLQNGAHLHPSHFLYLKYQMVSAEQKIIRPMAKI